MTLPDPTRSSAVIVGVSEFDDPSLDALPTVPAGVRRLRDLLVDPSVWGLPPDRCTVVLNPRSGDELLDPIADGCAAAEDAFLLYYAGHGILDPRPFELYLATVGTKLLPIRRSLRFDDIRRVLEPRRSLAKVALLDCCYSGLAIGGTMSDGIKVSDQLLVNRSYIMTATSATRLALAPPDEPYPAFTGELIRVLGGGIDGGPDELTMASIYGQVLSGLAAKRRPTPQASADNDGHTIVLARNRAVAPPADRPAPVRRDRADPVEFRGLEPVPESHRIALRLSPAETVDYLTGPTGAERDAALQTIGRGREPQELAAVVHALRRAGADDLASAVVAAVIGRPARDILAVVDNLDVLGLGGMADDLLCTAGRSGDPLVCALSPHLPEPRRELLVEAAVRHRVAEPAAAIRLVGMLWATESRPAVERVLRELAATMRPEDAAVFADAMSRGGYDEAAFALYTVAEDVLVARSPRASVWVAVAMKRAGHDRWAQRLLARIADRCHDAATAAEAAGAFWSAGLTDAAGDLLEGLATRLDDSEIMHLARRLRGTGRADKALDLLKRAAARRPVTSTQEYFRFLFDLGLPMDAHGLLQHVGTVLDGAALADVAVYVDEVEPAASYPVDLMRAAAARGPACARDLLVRLHTGSGRLVDRAEREIAGAGPEHGLATAVLIRDEWPAASDGLVRATAARFAGPDVVAAFVRTLNEMRALDPHHDLASTLRADLRVTTDVLATLIRHLPVGAADPVLGALLRLVPEAREHLVDRLLVDSDLRLAVGRADLWRRVPTYVSALLSERSMPFQARVAQIEHQGSADLLAAFADQVVVNGSVAEILELLTRTGVAQRVLTAMFAPGTLIDRWDPRRFHVAERLVRAGQEPPVPFPLRRPTPVAIAVSELLLTWSATDYRPYVATWTRTYGPKLGLHPDDQILLMAWLGKGKVLTLTATGMRFGSLSGWRQAVLPYAEVAQAGFQTFGAFTVRVLRRGEPVILMTLARDLVRSLPDNVPEIWFDAAGLAGRLTELGALVRSVLAVDPQTPPGLPPALPPSPPGAPPVLRRALPPSATEG